jgi:hypothetical protein
MPMWILTAILITIGFSSFAEEAKVNLQPLAVRSVKIQAPNRDKHGQVTIHFTLAEGFHAYLQQFKISANSPSGVTLTEPLIDPVSEFYDPVSKKNKKGATGSATLTSTLVVPYMAKRKSSCLSVTKPVRKSTASSPLKYKLKASGAQLTVCLAALPVASVKIFGSLYFLFLVPGF